MDKVKRLLVVKDKVVMVEKFQCPGCVCGMNIECGSYKPADRYGHHCDGHVLGTTIMGIGHIALGLPRGFCRMEASADYMTPIRLWVKGERPDWDKFNIPVWAMVKDGYLFVRTVQPRMGRLFADVVEGGTLDMVPNAVDVGQFVDEID